MDFEKLYDDEFSSTISSGMALVIHQRVWNNTNLIARKLRKKNPDISLEEAREIAKQLVYAQVITSLLANS